MQLTDRIPGARFYWVWICAVLVSADLRADVSRFGARAIELPVTIGLFNPGRVQEPVIEPQNPVPVQAPADPALAERETPQESSLKIALIGAVIGLLVVAVMSRRKRQKDAKIPQ